MANYAIKIRVKKGKNFVFSRTLNKLSAENVRKNKRIAGFKVLSIRKFRKR